MVVAYQVGQAWQKGICTIYQQHARYMTNHGIQGTPRELFQSDLVQSIMNWIESSNRLILFIDMNKHIITSNLPQKFLRLSLKEGTHKPWGAQEPGTFVYSNRKPIDGVYHTPESTITALMQLSFHEGVGDHQTILLDISTSLATGKFERRVVPPKARWLVTKNEQRESLPPICFKGMLAT
jgi:hypothetical protein